MQKWLKTIKMFIVKNISKDANEFIQIPEVSGSCFQPSVEDIGFKVLVHAIPASDIQEY